ncbi:MAG: ABC transporter permease [Actinomycetota bacterium]
MASLTGTVERTSQPPRLRVGPRLRELARHREVLANLIRRELRVKYTASALGALWSVLNPVVFLAVFSFVVRVTGNTVPDFPIYLLAGLLPWNLFSTAISTGTRSVVDNANLVKKVAFPHEILPLAAVGVAVVDFVLQSAVLLVAIVLTGHALLVPELFLYPLAVVALLVVTLAATLWLAALNVRYRDVQHLLSIGLLVWFWFTPIVYTGALVQRALDGRALAGLPLWDVFLVNPMASVVFGFQRALYGVVAPAGAGGPVLPEVSVGWLAGVLGGVTLVGLLLLRLTWGRFFDASGDFAEDL